MFTLETIAELLSHTPANLSTYKNPTLYIMVGVPGSGKSTAAKYISYLTSAETISRDEIRFNLIGENASAAEYFSKEKEVKQIFFNKITRAIQLNKDVIADATHLVPSTREYLFKQFNDIANIVFVFIDTPLDECLINNAAREGLHKVPYKKIIEMYKNVHKNVLLTNYQKKDFRSFEKNDVIFMYHFIFEEEK